MNKVSKPPAIDGIDLSIAVTWSRHQQFAAYSGQVVRAHRYIEDLMDILLKDYRLRVFRDGKPTSRPTYHEKYKCLNRHWTKENRAGRWVWEAVRRLNDCRNEMAHGVSRSDTPPWGLARAELKQYVEYVEKHGPEVVEPAAGVLPAGEFNKVTVVLAISIQQLALVERRTVLRSDTESNQREALRALFE